MSETIEPIIPTPGKHPPFDDVPLAEQTDEQLWNQSLMFRQFVQCCWAIAMEGYQFEPPPGVTTETVERCRLASLELDRRKAKEFCDAHATESAEQLADAAPMTAAQLADAVPFTAAEIAEFDRRALAYTLDPIEQGPEYGPRETPRPHGPAYQPALAAPPPPGGDDAAEPGAASRLPPR